MPFDLPIRTDIQRRLQVDAQRRRRDGMPENGDRGGSPPGFGVRGGAFEGFSLPSGTLRFSGGRLSPAPTAAPIATPEITPRQQPSVLEAFLTRPAQTRAAGGFLSGFGEAISASVRGAFQRAREDELRAQAERLREQANRLPRDSQRRRELLAEANRLGVEANRIGGRSLISPPESAAETVGQIGAGFLGGQEPVDATTLANDPLGILAALPPVGGGFATQAAQQSARLFGAEARQGLRNLPRAIQQGRTAVGGALVRRPTTAGLGLRVAGVRRVAGAAEKQPWEMTRDEFVRRRVNQEMRRLEQTGSVPRATRSVRGADVGERTTAFMVSDERATRRRQLKRQFESLHAARVEDAVRRGVDVPEEVLSDYPRFQKREWQKTLEEIDAVGDGPVARARARRHREDVIDALRRGDPVPDRVLADYPDLAEQFGRSAEPPAPRAAEEAAPARAPEAAAGDLPDVRNSPEYQQTLREINEITAMAQARREASTDPAIRALRPTDDDWLTTEERQRLGELQLRLVELAPSGVLRREAAARVAARRATRANRAPEPAPQEARRGTDAPSRVPAAAAERPAAPRPAAAVGARRAPAARRQPRAGAQPAAGVGVPADRGVPQLTQEAPPPASRPPAQPPAPPRGAEPPSGGGGQPTQPTQGVRLLPDPQPVETQIRVAFEENAARRVATRLANARWVGGPLRIIIRLGNPAAVADLPLERAAVTRAMLREEGRRNVFAAMSHANQIGTQADLFGPTDARTGLLRRGPLKGLSVNQIAENTSRYADRLTPEQREWLRRMEDIERETLALFRRNDVDIREIPPGEVERYAGRVVVGKVTPEGELIEAGFVGGPSRLGAQAGAEKARRFATVEEAQRAGFVFIPYEEAVHLKARAAYNRVADKRIADWVLNNLPDEVRVRNIQDAPLAYGEAIIDVPAFRNRVFTGAGAAEFRREFERLFLDARTSAFLRGVNQMNALQRTFALAGDASLFSIQLLAVAFRHPFVFARSGGVFARSLVTAFLNPAAARRFRADLVARNRDVAQRIPNLLLSNSNEFTEALGRGGLLSSDSLFGKAALPLRPFQQAFETTMDAAGLYLAKGLEHLADGDPAKLNAIGDYVNQMRGLYSSARVGVSPNQALAESAFLLAPRYRRAIAALHASALQGGLRGKLAREAYLSLVAGVTLTYAALTIALGVKQGKSVEEIREDLQDGLNPASSRFLLWRFGGQFVGVGSKFVSDARFLAKLAISAGDALGLVEALPGQDVTDFSEFQRNPGVKWVRGQLASIPAAAWDVFIGRDYLGEPVSLADPKSLARALGENVIPLWLQGAIFDGGTASQRALRGGAEFSGLRAYPEYDSEGWDEFSRAWQDAQSEWSEVLELPAMDGVSAPFGPAGRTADVTPNIPFDSQELTPSQRAAHQRILNEFLPLIRTFIEALPPDAPVEQREIAIRRFLNRVRDAARQRFLAQHGPELVAILRGETATPTPTPQRRTLNVMGRRRTLNVEAVTR